MLVYRVEKSKLSKCLVALKFLRASVALSIIQKQLTPEFRAIPSQYCLKCLVISLRLNVNSCESGLVVHALEAAMNLLPTGLNFVSCSYTCVEKHAPPTHLHAHKSKIHVHLHA